MNANESYARRDFLRVAATALGAGYWTQRTAAAVSPSVADSPGVHGMLVVGEQAVYLSHLPMFGSPHDYQSILEVTLTGSSGDPQADYFSDRKRTAEKIYTLEPERFVLTDLVADTPKRSFKGSLYRGHFERFPTQRAKDAALIADGVDVSVTKVIHFHKFDPKAAQLSQLEYLLFGKATELFLAHSITKPPDFDHVLSVQASQPFTNDELGRGVSIAFAERTNESRRRITSVQPVMGRPAGTARSATPITFRRRTEFYFEERELA
jgi:hypothetical protein